MNKLKFGLLGHNIGYSKSVDIFMAIFDHLGLQGSFVNFDYLPDNFETEFTRFRENEEVAGLSVTIPFKRRVISLLDELHPVARALDAVNSIAFQNGKMIGFNTDRDGFGWPLQKYTSRLKHSHAAVLGCGGSAKAAIYALHTDYEVDRITVFGRSREKLSVFKESLNRAIEPLQLHTEPIHTLGQTNPKGFSIVVNCTPLGGANHPDKSPLPSDFVWPSGKIYYDLNYNKNNQLVRQAVEHGLTVLDGSAMLTAQALKSFEIWTGQTVPFEPIHQAVFNE
ncbi:MAG TPA: shikimate dehydrogenase [candidate division Zixibacteria bacterium]|nr:shikimate dehydrogenase [candidate division Zixibacteria bacterium]